MEGKSNYMKYKNIKEELIKENGNRCSICGKNFDDDEQIDIGNKYEKYAY